VWELLWATSGGSPLTKRVVIFSAHGPPLGCSSYSMVTLVFSLNLGKTWSWNGL
jgi:hypothetical protein